MGLKKGSNVRKKFIAVLITIAMVMSLMPVGAMAQVASGVKSLLVGNSLGAGSTPSTASTPSTPSTPVSGIKLDKTAMTITTANAGKLTVVFTPVGATNKNIDWSSSDPSVAAVEENGSGFETYGMVNGYKAGTATITASSEDGGFTASCDITVIEAPKYHVATADPNVPMLAKVGASLALALVDENGNPAEESVTWTVTGDDCTISQDGVLAVSSMPQDGDVLATATINYQGIDAIYNKWINITDDNKYTFMLDGYVMENGEAFDVYRGLTER